MLIMVVLATVVFGLVVVMALRAQSRPQRQRAARTAGADAMTAWFVPGTTDGGACDGGGGGACCDGGPQAATAAAARADG